MQDMTELYACQRKATKTPSKGLVKSLVDLSWNFTLAAKPPLALSGPVWQGELSAKTTTVAH